MIKTLLSRLRMLHLFQFFQRLDQNQVRFSPHIFCLNYIINNWKHKDNRRSSGLVILALQEVHQLWFWVMREQLILLAFSLHGQLDIQCLFHIGIANSNESFWGIHIWEDIMIFIIIYFIIEIVLVLFLFIISLLLSARIAHQTSYISSLSSVIIHLVQLFWREGLENTSSTFAIIIQLLIIHLFLLMLLWFALFFLQVFGLFEL